jgi:hypothetical protein
MTFLITVLLTKDGKIAGGIGSVRPQHALKDEAHVQDGAHVRIISITPSGQELPCRNGFSLAFFSNPAEVSLFNTFNQ